MSGWWFAASAILGDMVDELHGAGKVGELILLGQRFAIARPAGQPGQVVLNVFFT